MKGKWGIKKNNLASFLKNTTWTCLRCQEYFCMPCSVFENDETVKGWKVGSFSRILWAVSEKLLKSTKWCNVMIQMNPAKIEIYTKQEECSSTKRKSIVARKYGIGPRPSAFSFSVHEIKVRIDTRHARLNQLPRQCRSKLGPNSIRFGTWVERRLYRVLDVLAVHIRCLGTGTKWCCVHTLSTWYKTLSDATLKHELGSENKAVDCPRTNKNGVHTGDPVP